MDMYDREMQDFMNMESFSYIFFIRPAPIKDKAIRIFRKELDGAHDSTTTKGPVIKKI